MSVVWLFYYFFVCFAKIEIKLSACGFGSYINSGDLSSGADMRLTFPLLLKSIHPKVIGSIQFGTDIRDRVWLWCFGPFNLKENWT